MEISYLGLGCFKIAGKNIVCVTDPFLEDIVGVKLAKIDADVVIITDKQNKSSDLSKIKGSPLILDGPGEYEVRGSEFKGIYINKKGENKNRVTIFTFEIDDIRVCHLSSIDRELGSEHLEEIDGVDILFVPCGGSYTFDSETAAKIVSEIEPKIVIPMHYRIGRMAELEPVDKFLQEMGAQNIDRNTKFKVTKKDLPEETEVVVLDISI